MIKRLMLPLLLAACLGAGVAPMNAQAAPAMDLSPAWGGAGYETESDEGQPAAPGIVGNDMNTDVDTAPATGGIAKPNPKYQEGDIVQYYGSDMNDVDDSSMVSWPFVLAAVLLMGLLAVVFFRLKTHNGFADHFGR